MPTAFEDFADQMNNLADSGAVWRCTAEFGHNLGFSSCSLTLAERSEGKLESRYLQTDLGDEFHDAYTTGELIDIDPFLLFSCHKPSAEMVLTRDLSSFPGSSPKHQEFLDRMAQAGNTGGIGNRSAPARTRFSAAGCFPAVNPKRAFTSWSRTMVRKPTWQDCWPMNG